MTSIIDAIKALDADAQVVVNDEPSNQAEYETNVKYISGADENGSAIYKDTQDFTWDQVSAKKAELQTAYDNNEYQRKRASEYPAIVDQLDDIFHNGIDGWKTTIQAVKDKYPKE
tara:strand:+ start:1974 stop:2318 length:345 start_codon:yes stop_codon:yes gene_type:complete